MPRSILYSELLASILCLISLSVNAVERGITIGISDFIVTDITPNSIHDGTTSHAYGINAGVFFKHTFVEDIVVGGSADFYLEHDKDHTDPDHIPLWYKLQLYSFGPIHKTSKNTDLKWLVDIRNKENTVSGIEREIKCFFGLGINSHNERSHIALNVYTGFFYLEFDDDAPNKYAGYERIDLDDGTAAVSAMIEGSLKLTDRFTFSGSATNWSSMDGEWLENELMAKINYASDDWIKDSTIHLCVLHTHYNLDIHYRETLGKPILPWDKDVLVRLYVSLPWDLN